MISYAAIGGMKGTAFIQIVKTVVLLGSRPRWSPCSS